MYNLLKLNLARNALRYIIKEYGIKKLHIPYYLCNVVRKSILKEDCKPVFYHINNDFLPEKEFEQEDYILYPNYFGICDKNVEKLSEKYPKLIVDNAHSFFSKPEGFACFNSARKFLTVCNGSFLWIKNCNLKLKEDPFFSNHPDSDFEILKNENLFETFEPCFMNKKVSNSIKQLDLKTIKEKRREVFENYHKKYGKENLLKTDNNSSESPFCYPFLAKNETTADELVKALENQGLKIYRYWDNIPENYNEYKFYKRLVCIPIEIKD